MNEEAKERGRRVGRVRPRATTVGGKLARTLRNIKGVGIGSLGNKGDTEKLYENY